MQDFRSMQASIGGGGRIFGGDRRLRPFPNQALKCPRCESLNTKFCYYNNYNLSQPRHFCKSCRRYWTKGGVLRNVPVGGGCRKTKRSSKQKQPSQHKDKESKASMVDNSSSESSSLTNNTTTEAAAAAVAFTSTPGLIHNNNIFNFEASMLDSGGLFAETGGSFTSMMTVSNPTSSSFLMYNNLSEISLQVQLQQEEEMKMQELTSGGCLDQTVPVDFRGMCSQELTALDWQNGDGNSGGDQTTLFDLPNSSVVDHGYWGQSQWTTTDHDQHLYLPP